AAGHAVAARVPAVRGGPPHPARGAGPVTAPLASAADLAGHDLGDGTVALEWTYPTDPAAAGVRFDVYAGSDPLAPLRSLALPGHPGTTASLGGFDAGGDRYFTVVARRGVQLALPSAVLRVPVRPVRPPVVPTPERVGTQQATGLGFPFGV